MTGSERQAAAWFTAMQGGNVSQRERALFVDWLGQSAQHVEEYLAVAALWRSLDSTDDAQRSAEELLAAARADDGAHKIVELPLSPTPPASIRDRIEGFLSWRRIAAAIALMAFGLAAGFFTDWHVNGRRYVTDVGEQSSYVLADGSVVKLNTQSSVRVRMRVGEREISLLEGEAMFEVAKDPSRPFRVHAGNTVVEAVGTVFNVYRARGETRVTVLEGQVRVLDTAGENSVRPNIAPVVELQARERARVPRAGAMVKERDVSLEQVTAWTDRRLVFYTETLQTVVEEFNRYNTRRLRVIDPELAALHISGHFSATDPDSLVQFLERTESVSATPAEDGVTELSRK